MSCRADRRGNRTYSTSQLPGGQWGNSKQFFSAKKKKTIRMDGRMEDEELFCEKIPEGFCPLIFLRLGSWLTALCNDVGDDDDGTGKFSVCFRLVLPFFCRFIQVNCNAATFA
uniref:Uncharacterized protein n=1 Tax=Anopheles atroparvus TaxID=41427 RepID=A0AAG5DAY8_ANOAO